MFHSIAEAHAGEDRILITNIGWDDYLALLNRFESGGPGISFDGRDAEVVWPQFHHERCKQMLSRVVTTVTEELDLPMVAAGSTTLSSERIGQGLEPDAGFYLANAARLRRALTLGLSIDPVPDLAIEVDLTLPLLDPMRIYAALAVREVWRFDGEPIKVLILGEEGSYSASETSLAFPFLPMVEVTRFLVEYDATNDTRWGRGFRAWVREVVEPRFRGGV